MDYLTWIIYAFPMFLLQAADRHGAAVLDLQAGILDMSRAVARLRTQVMMDGPLKPSDWLSIGIFVLTILGWIFLSDTLGLGSIALIGVCAFLVFGLVRWEEINPASIGVWCCSMRPPSRSASRCRRPGRRNGWRRR